MKHLFFLCLIVLLFIVQVGLAQIPQTISYQGVLTDTSGSPVSDGNYDFTFNMYEVATSGTAIWTETQSGVAVTNGIFNVILGSVNPLDLPFDKAYWLGITIGTGTELSPRIELTSAAYSLNTANADSGDITAVNAGNGLSGGGTSGDVTLDVGAGTGISISEDGVAMDTLFTDARYLNEGEANSVSTAMIQDNAVSVDKVSPDIISSLNGVSNDGGNIDLVAGSNVSIVPDDAANTITISSSGGTGGGDITAVDAGSGLTGGGTEGDVTLDIGAGTGITVGADQVSLDTNYTHAQYVNEGQSNSISSEMIQDGQVSNTDLASNAVTSAKIQDGEVQQADIATGAVTTNEILNSTIQGADLANQSVNEDKIDPTNASTGQALMYDGTSVVWQTPAGLGDISSVTAGSGLTGGGTSGDITLDVGAGTGITVAADQVALNTTYTDAQYVNEGQTNSISNTMIQDNAVNASKISPDVVSSVDGVSNDAGDIDLVQGANITITPNDAANTITIAAPNVGDITAVTAGDGLTGGGTSADVTLDVGAGTGISVAADQISLNTTYTDGQYVNEGQSNSISSTMIQDGQVSNADLANNAVNSAKIQDDAVTASKISPDVVSSVDGVSNDAGDIDLVQGANITITPNDAANTITIAAPNVGDITAVTAGNGLTGGGTSGDVTLDIGAGTGISVAANSVALNTSYTDGLYVNEGQANSISSTMIQDGQVLNADLANNAVNSAKIQDGQVNTADLANSAVTAAKISSSGASADNVLTYDGQNVLWQAIPPDQDWTVSGSNIYRTTGNVGIGTTSPTGRLHVATTGQYGGYFTSNYLNASTHVVHGQFTGIGNYDAYGVYGSSVPAAYFGYGGYFVGGYRGVQGSASISGTGYRYGVSGYGANGASYNYGVYGSGYGGTIAYGVYGIASGGSSMNYGVYSSGNLGYSGSLIGPIQGPEFNENVQPLTGALDKLMQLNANSFQFTQNTRYDYMNLPSGKHYGLSVREVEQVLPELVSDNMHPSAAVSRGERSNDPPIAYKGINYMEMIPILVEAIKEQQQEIETLKAEITMLKSKR